MKERPILFSALMVRALLDGSKKQTRRVVKPQPYRDDYMADRDVRRQFATLSPYGQPGDRLWVRETWVEDPDDDGTWAYTQYMGCKGSPLSDIPTRFQKPEHCIFRADWTGHDLVWRPSIHMPRWASRILLEIVSVRLERLNECSEADARAEGIRPHEVRQIDLFGASAEERANMRRSAALRPFEELWEQINGAGSWAANPWVWVVEFKRVAP